MTPEREIGLTVHEVFPDGVELLRVLQETLINARRNSGARRIDVIFCPHTGTRCGPRSRTTDRASIHHPSGRALESQGYARKAQDLARRAHPIHHRHGEVHQDHGGFDLQTQRDGLLAGVRLTYQLSMSGSTPMILASPLAKNC